jgi:hypothetical protein
LQSFCSIENLHQIFFLIVNRSFFSLPHGILMFLFYTAPGGERLQSITEWLLQQLNARDSLDAVAITVKIAVQEMGSERVAEELRGLAEYLEDRGDTPGWNFPRRHSA